MILNFLNGFVEATSHIDVAAAAKVALMTNSVIMTSALLVWAYYVPNKATT